MKFIGNGKTATITENKLVITKSGLIGYIDGKNGHIHDTVININEITNIECKDASIFSNGFIRISVNGKHTPNTTIMFMPKRGIYQEALAFTQTLDILRQQYKSSSNFSVADEIKKFKELLDMGAITYEEFEKKKKELLN